MSRERVFYSRKHPRIPLEMEVEFSKGRKFTKAISHNISHGGIFIQSENTLPGGKKTTLRFVLDPDKEPVELKGRIAWVMDEEMTSSSDRPMGMGIEFLYEDETNRDIMAEFVRDLLDLMRIMAINSKRRQDH